MSGSANKSDSRADRQQALRDQGFELGEPIHDYPITFTRADAQASIFESTYENVRAILIGSADGVVRVPSCSYLQRPASHRSPSHPELRRPGATTNPTDTSKA
jgi:hypothetical protein